MSADGQLFDDDGEPTEDALAKARRERDEALDRVERGAPDDWKAAAYDALVELARTQDTLTADDLWAADIDRPREPRASGAIWKRAAKAGVIAATPDFAPSTRRHATPVRVWRSLIKEG